MVTPMVSHAERQTGWRLARWYASISVTGPARQRRAAPRTESLAGLASAII